MADNDGQIAPIRDMRQRVGLLASQAVLTTLQHCAGPRTIISPSTLMERRMRKPRDFDAELKALGDKARDLKPQGAAARRTRHRHGGRRA